MAEEIGYVEDTTPVLNAIAILGVIMAVLMAFVLFIVLWRR